jgi:hypothetical protein
MRKHLVIAAALGAAAVPLTALPVSARTSSTTAPRRTVSATRQRCTAAIDVRLVELTKLDGRLGSASHLTNAHRSTLGTIIGTARTGLTGLRTKIAADTDAATLKADCQAIVQDYRVFALRAPQVHLTVASDTEAAAVSKIQALEPKLSSALDAAEAKGVDVTAARQAYADLTAKVTDAGQAVAGLGDGVIAYAPADYNADHALLDPARAAVKSARADLRAARDDAKAIAKALRSASSTSTTAAAQ